MTATERPSTVPDLSESLLADLAARAPEGERLRTLPPDLVERIEAAGLFRMMRVRALGGLETEPPTVVDVVERVACADASAAWAILIGATANGFTGWLGPDVAQVMVDGCRDAASSCVFAPSGLAVPVDDAERAFTVRGRWSFNSGIVHAAWHQVGVLISDDGAAPRMSAEGVPDMRLAFVPAGEGRVDETWDTMGLRGTGSHDLVLDGVVVPATHMTRPADGNRHDGAYARLSLGDLVQIGVLGFPLGVARRALEEFAVLARDKTRGIGRPWAVAEDAAVQSDLGRAEIDLAAARAFADAAVTELWDAVREPTRSDPNRSGTVDAARGRLAMATQHAVRAGVSVVDAAYRHAGVGAAFLDHPLQRCFRDVHTVAQHIFFAGDTDRRVARRRLGLPDTPSLL